MSSIASAANANKLLTMEQGDTVAINTTSNVSIIKNKNTAVTTSPITSLKWGAIIGGSDEDNGRGIAVDLSGNTIVVGNSWSTDIKIYNTSGLAQTGNMKSASGRIFFVAKFDPSGVMQWFNTIDGSSNEDIQNDGVAVDSAGNVLATGFYLSTNAQIYNTSGAGIQSIRAPANGGSAAFVVKFSASGTVLWYSAIGNGNNEVGSAIAADPSGNVYATGFYSTYTLNVYNTAGNTIFTYPNTRNGGGNAVYVIKYSPTGSVLWTSFIDGSNDERGVGISADNLGDTYVIGRSTSTDCAVYNNAGSSVKTFPASQPMNFVVKYNVSGVFQWVLTFNAGAGTGTGNTMADNSGNVYVTMPIGTGSPGPQFFNNAGNVIMTAPQSNSTIVMKLLSNGAIAWASTIGGGAYGTGIAYDMFGNVYACGAYSGQNYIYNTSGALQTIMRTPAFESAYLIKYSASGTLLWTLAIDGTSYDSGWAVATDAVGDVYFTGTYAGSSALVFNTSGVQINRLPPSQSTGIDTFILALTSGNTTTTLSPYTLASTLTASNLGFRKFIYHATSSNATIANVNITNTSGTVLTTYSLGQTSNLSLMWLDNQWVKLN